MIYKIHLMPEDEEEVVLPEVCYTPVDADETKEISQFRDKVGYNIIREYSACLLSVTRSPL